MWCLLNAKSRYPTFNFNTIFCFLSCLEIWVVHNFMYHTSWVPAVNTPVVPLVKQRLPFPFYFTRLEKRVIFDCSSLHGPRSFNVVSLLQLKEFRCWVRVQMIAPLEQHQPNRLFLYNFLVFPRVYHEMNLKFLGCLEEKCMCFSTNPSFLSCRVLTYM